MTISSMKIEMSFLYKIPNKVYNVNITIEDIRFSTLWQYLVSHLHPVLRVYWVLSEVTISWYTQKTLQYFIILLKRKNGEEIMNCEGGEHLSAYTSFVINYYKKYVFNAFYKCLMFFFKCFVGSVPSPPFLKFKRQYVRH